MRICYEPNRLAKNHLSDAYEKLILTVKHPVKINDKKNDKEQEIITIVKGNLKWKQ